MILALAAASAVSADTQTQRGSVALSSTSATRPVVLDQFDPAVGNLTRVTVTLGLQARARVAVTNLTPATKATTVSLRATASTAGPGVSGLASTVATQRSRNLGANRTGQFALNGTTTRARVGHESG